MRTGFGVTPAPDQYPGKDTLRQLMNAGIEPRMVWRAVLFSQLAPKDHPLRHEKSWLDRTRYVEGNPETIDVLFWKRDAEFDRRGVYFLTLFDALDRCADGWNDMYRAIRGLMQTALEMRSYKRLRAKVFLRSDQIDESEIGDFPDASKVLASPAELNWPRHELYGLLWHCLGNGRHGADLRDFLEPGDWPSVRIDHQSLFSVPRIFIRNEEIQRKKFHEIAGPWMGKDRRRGFPYTWIPNHLGDTEVRVSPRSFLEALRRAATDTRDQRPDHGYALHYESIKRGVQEASRIRVRELREDYPWVHQVLEPLRGMVVPCEFGDIRKRWRNRGVLDRLNEQVQGDEVKLPPLHLEQGANGVRRDLESLCIFLRMHDGRVNIPDVFRVGYGLGRRGGVHPVR